MCERGVSRRLIVAISVLIAWACPSLAQINYSKSVDIAPLRISFEQLQRVLNKAASLMIAANGSVPLFREEMSLHKGGLHITMSGHAFNAADAKVPSSLDEFEYSASTHERAPITQLSMRFSDFRRSVSIEGQSPDQIDALLAALNDELSSMSTPLGGGGFLISARGVVMVTLGIAILLLTLVLAETRRIIFVVPISVAVTLFALVIVLPLSEIFAGFSVVQGDPSFYVRYGSELSLFGFMVTVLSFFAPMLQKMRENPNASASITRQNGRSTNRRRGR